MSSTTEDRKNTIVVSNLGGSWPGYNEETPALILNPRATPMDLLAWCWAEMQSLNATVLRLSCSTVEMEPSEVLTILNHRVGPLTNVMKQAVGELVAEDRKRVSTSKRP